MRASKRDQVLVFQRLGTATVNALNERIREWAELGREYGATWWGNSAERREAGREQASQAAIFVTGSTSMTRGVKVTDRILHDGKAWDITGIAPMNRNEIHFTAMAAVEG